MTNPEDSRAYLLRTLLTWTSKRKLQSPILQWFWVFKIVLNTQGRQREPVKEFSKTLSLQVTLTVQSDIQNIYSISILWKSRVLLVCCQMPTILLGLLCFWNPPRKNIDKHYPEPQGTCWWGTLISICEKLNSLGGGIHLNIFWLFSALSQKQFSGTPRFKKKLRFAHFKFPERIYIAFCHHMI